MQHPTPHAPPPGSCAPGQSRRGAPTWPARSTPPTVGGEGGPACAFFRGGPGRKSVCNCKRCYCCRNCCVVQTRNAISATETQITSFKHAPQEHGKKHDKKQTEPRTKNTYKPRSKPANRNPRHQRRRPLLRGALPAVQPGAGGGREDVRAAGGRRALPGRVWALFWALWQRDRVRNLLFCL
jgi:hypothetical protein